MRRVLVDHARTRGAQKRGDGDYKVPLEDDMAVSSAPDVNLVDLDRALDALALVDERKCRVIEMRFFGGMTVEETAEVLHVSIDTVNATGGWRSFGCYGSSITDSSLAVVGRHVHHPDVAFMLPPSEIEVASVKREVVSESSPTTFELHQSRGRAIA